MKKQIFILILPFLLAACAPQTIPPEATATAPPTEAPVTNGVALFEEETLRVGNQIGSFTVAEVERDENGRLISAQFRGDLTVTGEWVDKENGTYDAGQDGMTGENRATLRCSNTSRDGLPKTGQDNTEDFTLLVSWTSPDVCPASGKTVKLRLTNLTYLADGEARYTSSDVQCAG